MKSQFSEDSVTARDRFPWRTRCHCVAILAAMLVSIVGTAAASASSPNTDDKLVAGHAALQEGDWSRGLSLLNQTPGDDPRVAYYRAYALEKLGRCREARASYEAVGTTDKRMAEHAERALLGLSDRCAEPLVEQPVRLGSGRVGWKVAGWTTLALGALTVLAVPTKASVERGAASEAEDYFQLRYECDVTPNEVSGADCKKAELGEDEIWGEYRERTAAAARMNRTLLIGGGATFGLGIATLLTVAMTRPGAVAFVASPTPDGARASIQFTF